VAAGGAQERLAVAPDLTTLGKIVGGGFPVGAYGGRADLMKRIAPEGPVYQAGTLSGNPSRWPRVSRRCERRIAPASTSDRQAIRLLAGLEPCAERMVLASTASKPGRSSLAASRDPRPSRRDCPTASPPDTPGLPVRCVSSDRRGRRTPDWKPAAHDLASVVRSGATARRSWAPPAATRNPVITHRRSTAPRTGHTDPAGPMKVESGLMNPTFPHMARR